MSCRERDTWRHIDDRLQVDARGDAINDAMTLIVVLMLEAASAQADKQGGVPGYTDPLRTDLEKKNDREIDRAYEATVKGRPDAERKNSDPWADVRPAPPAAAKKKQ